ncbi:hypothetical protein AR438_11620 [Chryseobacterium aquaticum]|uniref:Uncharacterized protein n=1 Tax=Chryseobacterium aquaticum TaxID=452084 RepID=A0A0Q3P9J4_9FLAO|nr:hypothetical protein [Chryseobacterium aquaticum]KQK26214.1 hypothetical protein AR438_11620 [Chryseobacterium aquaticum]
MNFEQFEDQDIIEPINNAVDLWTVLNLKAGIDESFYDKDLVEGNDSLDGIYQLLKIKKRDSFMEDLANNNVTVEKLINALFSVLQPYGMMMNDLCVFFEKYKIQKEDKTLQIEFDFSETEKDKLNFNLENFRDYISKIETVKSLCVDNELTSNHLWNLKNIFHNELEQIMSVDIDVNSWIDEFKKNGKIEMPNPAPTLPKTGNDQLDLQLDFCMRIWKSYVITCRSVSVFREIAKGILEPLRDKGNFIDSWPVDAMYYPLSDAWPASFINALFYRVEQLNLKGDQEKDDEAAQLSNKLGVLLDSFPIVTSSEDTIVKELVDLLNLPIWNQRHELYSAWVLTNIDKSFEGYPVDVHHTDGVLKIPFKPKKLMTIHSMKGDLLVFSEMLTDVKGLQSKKRKEHVQPDYVIFKNDNNKEDALVVIEVKQYRTPSNSNFGDAIKDYSIAFSKAYVILVNYGRMSNSLVLYDENRNKAYGEVYPESDAQGNFIEKLQQLYPKSVLPNFIPLKLYKEIRNYEAKNIIVDISHSMSSYDPGSKTLEAVLQTLLSCSQIDTVKAVDSIVRKIWHNPSTEDIFELLDLEKGNSTRFTELLPKEFTKGLLIITDEDGSRQIESYRDSYYLLFVLNGEKSVSISFKNLELFNHKVIIIKKMKPIN